MTSSVRIAAPFSTWAPSSTSSATTVPGSGATTRSAPACSSILHSERIDPVNLEAAVPRPDIDLTLVEQASDVMLDAIERKIDTAAREADQANAMSRPVDGQRRRPADRNAASPLARASCRNTETPATRADRGPSARLPRRMGVLHGVGFALQNGGDRGAKFKIRQVGLLPVSIPPDAVR